MGIVRDSREYLFLSLYKHLIAMLTEEELKKMLQNPAAADWSKLRAEDVSINMGMALTEEQMKAYCAQHNIQPTIMKKPPSAAPKKKK